jgi:hypothetical protein
MNDSTEADLTLRASLARLPRSVEPARDLWPLIQPQIGVSANVQPVPQGPRAGMVSIRWAIAASVASLAIGALLTWSLPHTQGAMAPSAPRGSGVTFVPASTDAMRQRLRSDVAAQLEQLPPATRDKVQQNLLLIKNAVTEIQASLVKDPGNTLLQDLLVTTYQNELDTLANVQALTRSARSEVSL